MILCHLIQKQPPKPPKNSALHKLLNQRKSHAIQNTRTQNCKEKAVAILKLALGIVAELKQTVWRWRDEYERLVMWWVFYWGRGP
jgi:hypothetical protein